MRNKYIKFCLIIFILMSFLFSACHNTWMESWWFADDGAGKEGKEPERSGANFAVVILDLNGGIQNGGVPGSGELGPFRVLYGDKVPRVRSVSNSDVTLGFGGWMDESGGTWDLDTRKVKPEDDADNSGFITLRARWVKNFVTVEFNMNYEDLFENYGKAIAAWSAEEKAKYPTNQAGQKITVPDQKVVSGGKIVEPPVMPTDGIHGLVGWFLTDEDPIDNLDQFNNLLNTGTKWDFDNRTVGNSGTITLHAVWGSSYVRTVHLQVNGGTRPNGQELTRVNFTVFTGLVGSQGGKIIDPGPLTREGYTFAGWYTNSGVEWNFATSLVKEVDNWGGDNKNILLNDYFTLHARWEPNIYYVTFDTAGGTPVPPRQEVMHGERAALPSTVITPPTINGVEQAFDGWWSDAGKTWDFDTGVVTSTMTLTAHWVPRAYTVRFYLGTGDGASAGKIPQFGTPDGKPYLEQHYKSSTPSARIIEPFMPALPANDTTSWSFLRWDVQPFSDPSDVANLNNPTWRSTLHALSNWTVSAQDSITVGGVEVINIYARWVPPVPDMVWVPRGSFTMGDSGVSGSPAAYHAYPTRQVKLDGFYISRHEVTQIDSLNGTIKAYGSLMDNNPSQFTALTRRPVERVSWYDAVTYCNKLTQALGLGLNVYNIPNPVTAAIPGTGSPGILSIISATVTWEDNRPTGFRLPTEAEWEYAARGGNGSPGDFIYAGSNNADAVAWYTNTVGKPPADGGATQVVGTKQANILGIYDMSGNVSEWVYDLFDSYKNTNPNGNPLTNPRGPVSGLDGTRVRRGGGWSNAASNVRSVVRNSQAPGEANWVVGFRVVRGPGVIW